MNDDLNGNGTFGDIPDTTNTSIVEFVKDTFVNAIVNPNVKI